jgi:hypothetical protein
MRTPSFAPVPRNLQAMPGSDFTPAMAAWSSPGALGALSLSSLPSWVGYAIAGAALFAAYKKKVPLWAGLAGAGAAYWFLIRGASTSAGTSITSGSVSVTDGTQYQLTAASPGSLSADGSTITIGGTAYPVLSTVLSPDGTSTNYYVDTPAGTMTANASGG